MCLLDSYMGTDQGYYRLTSQLCGLWKPPPLIFTFLIFKMQIVMLPDFFRELLKMKCDDNVCKRCLNIKSSTNIIYCCFFPLLSQSKLAVNPLFSKLNQSLKLVYFLYDHANLEFPMWKKVLAASKSCNKRMKYWLGFQNARDTIWRNLNVLMMASQQWPQDFLNESETEKHDSLVNKVLNQKPKWEAKNDKDTKSKTHFLLWPPARISSFMSTCVPATAPLTGKT